MRSLVCVLAMFALACEPDIPSGELLCARDIDCPPEWSCHRDGFCYAEPQAEVVCEREPQVGEVFVVPEGIARKLDVLFVIDDSNENGLHQTQLAAEIPGWIDALTTGDIDDDGVAELTPLESIHFAVTTTDMGTEPHEVPTCTSFGDDGQFLTTSVDPECVTGPYPTVARYEAGSATPTPASIAEDLGCLMRRSSMLVRGCGFEQPLEAMLKALTPSSSPIEFLRGTGHADGVNEGFLREDSVLAIVVLSSENDCSTRNPAIFELESSEFDAPLNLRCWQFEDELFGVQRYVDGLLAIRPDTSRLVFTFLTGTPADAGPILGNDDFDALLADPRMEERADPERPIALTPLCELAENTPVFPGRRLIELGREMQAAGAVVAVPSLCAPLEGALDAILDALQSSFAPECVSGTTVRAGGCEVVDPLPVGERCADQGFEVAWTEEGREICRIPLLASAGSPPAEGRGWFYDDVSERSRDLCGRDEGLVTGFGLTLDADATVQCDVPELAALGQPCTVGAGDCADIGLDCDSASFTCQRQCTRDGECGSGFSCLGLSQTVRLGVCSNPTCE